MDLVGPDRILPTDDHQTTKPDGSVKLKLTNDDPIGTKSLVTFATEKVTSFNLFFPAPSTLSTFSL